MADNLDSGCAMIPINMTMCSVVVRDVEPRAQVPLGEVQWQRSAVISSPLFAMYAVKTMALSPQQRQEQLLLGGRGGMA